MRVISQEWDVQRPFDYVDKRHLEGDPTIHVLTRNGVVVEAWDTITGEYWICHG